MPTAARLAAALCLALTALVASYFVRDILPERLPARFLFPINVSLGLVIGWVVIGRRAGRGMVSAVNVGLTGGVVLVFWSLFLFAFGRMWILSLRKSYKYPPDAMKGLLDEFIKYTDMLYDPRVLISLVLGAILTGIVTELVDRRYH